MYDGTEREEKICAILVTIDNKRVKKLVPEWYCDSQDFKDKNGYFVEYVEEDDSKTSNE